MRKQDNKPILHVKSQKDLEGTVYLSSTQVLLLNSMMPKMYKIDFSDQKNFRSRRTEIEENPINLPIKRAAREKDPEILNGQNDGFKKCYRLLQTLKRNSVRFVFLAREAQHKLIEDPITLKIVENKLESGEYLSAYHFARDIRKIISNAFLINATDPESFLQVFEFSTLFESLFKGHKDLFLTENAMQNLQSKIENLSQNIKDLQQKTPQAKLVKEKKMTPVEKKQLCQSIRKLDPKYFNGMLKIIKTCMNPQGNNLEFDIEKLPEKVCRELEKYIKQCLQVKPQRKKGPEVLKTELVMEDLAKPEQEIRSESSESSSSSSESEDEMPGPPIYSDSWDRDFNDYSNATIIDFDKY